MKKRTEENRRNLDMIAPTWTLLGLALTACGGGGGGSRVRDYYINFNTDPYTATAPETNQIVRLNPSLREANSDVTVSNIQVTSPQTASATLSERQVSIDFDFTITGADADDIRFVQDQERGDIWLEFVNVVDFENPRDANSDNVYLITITTRTSDTRLPSNLRSESQDYRLTVTDRVGDDQHSQNVDEGEVMILTLDDLDITQATISGDDAADVEIAEVNGEMVVRFRSAPDFDAPADSDSDNVYEFTLTDTATDVETHIEVTVIDVI